MNSVSDYEMQAWYRMTDEFFRLREIHGETAELVSALIESVGRATVLAGWAVSELCEPVWAEHPGWTVGQCVDHLKATGRIENAQTPRADAIRPDVKGRA